MEDKKDLLKLKPVKIAIACVAVLLCVIICIKVFTPKERQEINISSSIEKIELIDQLSSCVFPYNGLTELCNDKGKVITHISYEGEVILGIEHFSDITFEVDEENNKIKVKLPEIKVLDKNVISDKIDTLDDVKNELPELKRVAEEDLMNVFNEKNAENNYMYECAENIIKSTIETLISPITAQTEKTYEIVYE